MTDPRQDPTFVELKTTGTAAQGDLLIFNYHLGKQFGMDVSTDGFDVVSSHDGTHIVAHSETGHHHVLRAYQPDPGLLASLNLRAEAPVLRRNKKDADPEMRALVDVAEGTLGEVVHKREFFTHGSLILPSGTWVICRQGRPTPEGWKKVTD